MERPIRILRDTGSSLSVLLAGVLPLSEKTYTRQSVLLQGVEMGSIEFPLHRVKLKSELVNGEVVVGVKITLPFDEIALLIGNDLAGGRMKPDPIVTEIPVANDEEKNERYPVGDLTRNRSHEIDREDHEEKVVAEKKTLM